MPEMTLEDRIYCLKQTHLPDDLQARLVDADIAFLGNNDFKSMLKVTMIENECKERGIRIYQPRGVLVK